MKHQKSRDFCGFGNFQFSKHLKSLDILGTILLLTGFLLAFLPHAAHISIGLSDESSHASHIISGIALVIAGLAILAYNNDALKWKQDIRKFILRK